MPAHGLLILAPVRQGREDVLCETLNRLGNDIRGARSLPDEPRIEFTRAGSIHFAGFALLDHPEGGPSRKRLLFATDYDGSLERHLDEVLALTHRPDAIWGECEGYDGLKGFPEFIRRYAVEPGAYYIAFRGDNLGALRRAIDLTRHFNERLADPRAPGILQALPDLRDLILGIRKVLRGVWLPIDGARGALLAALEVFVLVRQHGFGNVFRAARAINATLGRIWWVRILNFILRPHPTPPPHRFSQATPGLYVHSAPPGYPPEDAIFQNQLTLLTDIRPIDLRHLQTVLSLIDLYGRRLSPPGSLAGISTIHTVRWAIIDGGRRLLMVSNYDGTWENYIDEFAEMILSGLDALWGSAPDYPLAGAQDLSAFKQFLRVHQVPANAFYSAYPEASVLNLQDAQLFARWTGPIVQLLTREGTNP